MIRKVIHKILYVSLFLGIAVPLIFFFMVISGYFGELPPESALKNINNPEASVVFDAHNVTVGKFYQQDRTPVNFNQIHPFLIEALLATEDQRFFTHKGIDLKSLFRVAIKTVLFQQRSSGGGSTISQQLAKNLYPRKSYQFLYFPINKTRELIIAYRLESIYTKEEILTLYLNTVSFGEDVYGIESASRRFFNKSAASLNMQESASLIGMLKATTSYNPALHPVAAKARRNVVLLQLFNQQKITQPVFDSLKSLPMTTDYQAAKRKNSTYFLAQVKRKLLAFLMNFNKTNNASLSLTTSGLKIYTTLDYGMQIRAEQALLKNMKHLQDLFDNHWQGQLWVTNNKLFLRELAKVTDGRTDDQLNENNQHFIFTYKGDKKQKISTTDSLKYYLSLLQAGFLALAPKNGEIKAWVGGIDFDYFPYDHVALQAKRQVGSVFKPIVYAAAIENGISPCTYYNAKQVSYTDEEGEWKPGNAGEGYDGKYSMEGALESSVNTVSVKILKDVGIDKTIALAKKLGIESNLPAVPSIALGTPSISLQEMVSAYAPFVNGGYPVRPHAILRIDDKDGNVLYEFREKSRRQVLSKRTANIMVHLLKSVVDNGTANSIRNDYKLPNDIGGKTGTTQSNADGWFIAISPHLITGAWVGGIYPAISFKDTRLGQGATMALPIIADFYERINKEHAFDYYAEAKFPVPSKQLKANLDCDPFKENFKWFKNIFSNEKNFEEKKGKSGDEKDGLFKKIGKLFKKKS